MDKNVLTGLIEQRDLLKKQRDLYQSSLDKLNEAIAALQQVYGGNAVINPVKKVEHISLFEDSTDTNSEGIHSDRASDPKGNRGWKEYILSIISIIGGFVHTSDIVDYVNRNNPDIPDKTVRSAARQYLWQLKNDDKIEAHEDGPKSKGYQYTIKNAL